MGVKSKFIIILLIPLILSMGIAPALPFVSASLASGYSCNNDQILVKRTADGSYVCVNPDTAQKWITRGLATSDDEQFKTITSFGTIPTVNAQSSQKPNIIVIMGDDIGWMNIGAYHRGIMAHTTPNIDKIAKNGMIFTDYYAEPSCTAGRAAFATGQLPIRVGLTTVGQAGVDHGIPESAPTIGNVFQDMGYTTGQFGKNHFGDLNKFLPTVHGFDEFFGYLYHLDAMEDPHQRTYPQELLNTIGPRNMVHSFASEYDDPTVQERWGKIGKQTIEDAGDLSPKRMETIDKEIIEKTFTFLDKAQRDDKPFFVWFNPSRVHVNTHLSDYYDGLRNSENGWSLSEAAHKEFDDDVGAIMNYLEENGLLENTIVIVTTDNGTENWTWPDGGQTPFAGGKADVMEGGVRVPFIIHWQGHVPSGTVHNGIFAHLDMLPTLTAAAGNPDIIDELKEGKKLGDKTFKVHLDGYNQLAAFTEEAESERHEIIYFMGPKFGAIRVDDYKYRFLDRPDGPFGTTQKLAFPALVNLRIDPFERTGVFTEGNTGSYLALDWYKNEIWRFVMAKQEVEKLAESFVDFPPLQGTGALNLKESIKQMRELNDKNN